MKTTQQQWGEDIHVGHATLKFADTYLSKKHNSLVPSGWIVPGGKRISSGDEAQYICYKMSMLIGAQKPFFPMDNHS